MTNVRLLPRFAVGLTCTWTVVLLGAIALPFAHRWALQRYWERSYYKAIVGRDLQAARDVLSHGDCTRLLRERLRSGPLPPNVSTDALRASLQYHYGPEDANYALPEDLSFFKLLLDAGAKPNETDLVLAAGQGKSATVRLLMKYGCCPAPRSREAADVLANMAYWGDLQTVKALLDMGCPINTRGANYQTPLLMAVWIENEGMVQYLLDRGASPNADNQPGMTPLMRAAQTGSVRIVKLMLRHGARLDAHDAYGATILQSAYGSEARRVLEQAGEK